MNIDLSTIASLATAIGVGLGVWEIRETKKIAQAQFEDSLDQHYRDLTREIPVDALIGKQVSAERKNDTRELIYNYLDLCNEQVFLRKKKKIRKDTWQDWCSGIEANLKKPAFGDVWSEIKQEAPGTFSFLEVLENEGFAFDPVRWRSRSNA